MSEDISVDKQIESLDEIDDATKMEIVGQFRDSVAESLSQEEIDTIANLMVGNPSSAETKKYGANGTFISALFYIRTTVAISNGKQFKGNAGGITGLGGGATFGHVYTEDVDRLYRETRRFQTNFAPAVTTVIFMDGSSRVLGTYAGGAVGTAGGIGGGTGTWS